MHFGMCVAFSLNLPSKRERRGGGKVSSLLQASIVLERKEINARTVTITGDIPSCQAAYFPTCRTHLNLQWTSLGLQSSSVKLVMKNINSLLFDEQH